MIRTPLKLAAAAAVVFFLSAWVAAPASAQRRKPTPTACNLKAIPLGEGNTWTYRSGTEQVILKVLKVEAGKDHAGKPATVATVEETYRDKTLQTVFTCTPQAGLTAPLESFFFTGEPGGGVGTTFTITSRDRVTWLPDDQLIEGNGWVEQVKADAARTDMAGVGVVHAPAQIEVERHVNVRGNTKIMIGLGEFNTQHVIVELRGRGIIGEERSEIPIKRPGGFWIQKGVGPIKIDDAFDKTWELVDTNLVLK